MITTSLRGGLGNQLFQYAAAWAAARRLGVEVGLDVRWFEMQSLRSYALAPFDLAGRIAKDRDLRGTPDPRAGVGSRAIGRLRRAIGSGPAVLLEPSSGCFDPRVLTAPDGAHLIGYWQSERYFCEFGSELRQQLRLTPTSSDIASQMRSASAVSVHVRRGDYESNPAVAAAHGVQGRPYYDAAMARLREELAHPYFFVFSDDPAWCTAEFRGVPDLVVVSGRTAGEHDDLALMSLAKGAIIANSSFSWWAAWMSEAPPEAIVAPGRWFADGSRDTTDLIPAGWVTL